MLDKTANFCGESAKGLVLCWFIFVCVFILYFFKIDRCAVLLFQRVKGQKSQRVLIPEAAQRETESLIEVVSGDSAVAVTQGAVPGESRIVL